MRRELERVGPWVLPVAFVAWVLSLLLTGCGVPDEVLESPARARLLTNAGPAGRAALQFYGEEDLTLPLIYGVPADEGCGFNSFWDPVMGECLGGRRNRNDGRVFITLLPDETGLNRYGYSFLCHELAHLVLARAGDSDTDHNDAAMWSDRIGPASLEARCQRMILQAPDLNVRPE